MNKIFNLKGAISGWMKNLYEKKPKAKPREVGSKSYASNISNNIFLGKISAKEQVFFARRLAFLTKAGVPILESLHLIKEQTKSKSNANIIQKVIDDVSNGQSLSAALGRYKKIFGEFAINIISIGESTGLLGENLEYLAEELRKKQILKRKIIGSLVYPAVIALATIGITAFLMVYLFPKIMPVFTNLSVTLPLSTRIVIAISGFLREYWLAMTITIAIAIFAIFFMVRKNKKIHFAYDFLILKIPIIGSVARSYNLANSSRTLGLLLKGGITLSEALPITAKTTANLVYRKEFGHLAGIVNRGERISVYLAKRDKLFPEILTQIISVGERSGNLPHSFVYLSELYEGEVEDFTKNLSSLIEPVLMIFMGLLVGFIAVSIISPIYGITQNLRP